MPNKTRKKIKKELHSLQSDLFTLLHSSEGRFKLLSKMAEEHDLVEWKNHKASETNVCMFVYKLAEQSNIKRHLSGVDQIAATFTSLVGDPASREEIDDLIVALGQNKIITPSEVVQLTAARLAE